MQTTIRTCVGDTTSTYIAAPWRSYMYKNRQRWAKCNAKWQCKVKQNSATHLIRIDIVCSVCSTLTVLCQYWPNAWVKLCAIVVLYRLKNAQTESPLISSEQLEIRLCRNWPCLIQIQRNCRVNTHINSYHYSFLCNCGWITINSLCVFTILHWHRCHCQRLPNRLAIKHVTR